MVRRSTLSCGVRVITEAMPHIRSATLGLWADVGSAVEPAEKRGISHMLEHMLFKGTERRTAREIAETMDAVGGNLNAFTDKEVTCYYARVIDRHVPLAVDVLSDMFLHATFEAEALAKEQKVILEEIRMYDDSPNDVVHELFARTMFGASPLGDAIIGTAQTVSALMRDDLFEHLRRRYRGNSVVVTAAGNIDHDAFVELLERSFTEFRGACDLPVPERPRVTPARRFQQKDTEQAYVIVGTPGLSARDPRRFGMSVLDTLLGGGMSSRLFQEVREKRGLAYSVGTFQNAYREAGLFGISAGTSPETVGECVAVIVDQLALLGDCGPSEAELQLTKDHIKGSLTLSLESSSSRMLRLGRGEFTLGGALTAEQIEAEIDAVSAEAVRALAVELFVPESLGLFVLGPVDEATVRAVPEANAA